MKKKRSENLNARVDYDQAQQFRLYASDHHKGNVSDALRFLIENRMNPMLHCVVERADGRTVAKFRSPDGSRTIQIANHPFRAAPFLIATEGDALKPASREKPYGAPALDRFLDLDRGASRYWWTSTDYREMCSILGLDPDAGRPKMSAEADEIAASLLAAGESSYQLVKADRLFDVAWAPLALAFDLIDAMRDDRFTPWDGGWKEPWVSPVGLAKLESRVDRFIEFPDFTACAGQALNYLRREKMGPPIFGEHWIEVRFLPSKHGLGRSKMFSIGELLDRETSKPDGGANELRQFNHIAGVAIAPDPGHPLSAAVRSRLSATGVRLVEAGNHEDRYMKREGRAWLDRHMKARPPRIWEKLLPIIFR